MHVVPPLPRSTSAPHLEEILRVLDLGDGTYIRARCTAPWALEFPDAVEQLRFHIVLSGDACVVSGPDGGCSPGPGDVVLLLGGHGHRLMTSEAVKPTPISAASMRRSGGSYAEMDFGGGGAATHLVSGGLSVRDPSARVLQWLLPHSVHIPSERAPERLRDILRLLSSEAAAPRTGADGATPRLADLVVIEALRACLATDVGGGGLWPALADPKIGLALMHIHREPSQPWTVASLADAAGMSRSGFAARFTELVGQPAMAYVGEWRMHCAAEELRRSSRTVAEISVRLGYRSVAAFSRAFFRVHGVSPSTVRNSGRSASNVGQ